MWCKEGQDEQPQSGSQPMGVAGNVNNLELKGECGGGGGRGRVMEEREGTIII